MDTMLLSLFLALLCVPLVLPAWALLVLAVAAVLRQRAPLVALPVTQKRPRVAVLVPAHNESHHVLPTIACLKLQLEPGDILLVVADNCTDDTAELALQAGAVVTQRSNPLLQGKGYALEHGVQQLRPYAPDVVMVVDADCVVSPGAVALAARCCQAWGRPVQLLNLMHVSADAGLRHRMLEFAMVVKNKVRPLGAYRLGGACHLMGTGMALPWALMSEARLATGHVAEDMKLGVDLALAGFAAVFVPDAEVSSVFPEDAQDAKVQKSRWEHGHMAILAEQLPPLLAAAVRRRQWPLLVLALDLMIPPLALYTLVLGAGWVLLLLAGWLWPVWQMALGVASLGVVSLVGAVFLSWWCHGRHVLRCRELLFAPLYAVWKIPIYVAYAFKKRSAWVRARRKSDL